MATEDEAYELIRDAIAGGDLHPNERLVEAELSTRFDASRSAIRIALIRLEQEGLIEHKRNHGAKVRVIGEDEATEIYQSRAVLEGLVAAQAARAADVDDIVALRLLLDRIEERLDASDLAAASKINAELHAEILRISRHATAQRLVAGLNVHLVRFQYRTIMHPDRPHKSLAEHRAIVDAIADHDAQRAEHSMRHHLELVTDTLTRPFPMAADL